MKLLIPAILIFMFAACAKTETARAPETDTSATATTAGKTYPMNAVIVSRNPATNMVNLDNENVPGVMAPMKMEYELRDGKVDALPPDGTKVQVTLHDQNGKYWVTEVKVRP